MNPKAQDLLIPCPGSDLFCVVLMVREQSTALFHTLALLFPAIPVTPALEKMP
jgi:hypothetical protein